MTDGQGATDKTIPGGAYVVGERGDKRVVDANGNPLDGWTVDQDGHAVPPAGQDPSEQKSDLEEPTPGTTEPPAPPPDTSRKGSKK